ncbi:hypothetical protein [Kineobactrum salinum]|uniref:Uncharacterized protein n=1 Tax=Kineobactrum salinum TaxID=2708301 RepID=A0A6C0U1N6_9GAMM|nr:hypothetical protein [Kineobactrum salinum]QIB66042.1 hypothetical protein G3T16_12070 [Kineobactrum salinum]
MSELLTILDTRWRDIFQRLAEGEDVPPGLRLRTEGMMEAALLQQLATQAELTARMDGHFGALFGHSIAQQFGADWQQFFPFPQIPAMARRAPVVPTTPDTL